MTGSRQHCKLKSHGTYLPPSTMDQLTDLEDVINQLPGRDTIIMGYPNADTRRLRNPLDQ